MVLTPGTRLGTYEILSSLGAGGMGEVYRARDTRLGREVAVKVLPAEVAAFPERLARFEREARTVAGLNHPNIVTLHSVEDEDGVRFLTMELVEGQTLVDLMTPGGLPLSRILELAIPLTDALTAAHARGVVHRDLKPGNVMVTREGRVKVLDFGLAKGPDAEAAASPGRDLAATATGEVMGTMPYMAPEQIRGETADARSDLFALGILLHEIATGRRPFTGETSVDVGHAILRDPPEPLSRARGDLPAEFERIVSRCLEKDPRERAQSALDVNNELRRLRRTLERGDAATPSAPANLASIAVLPFVNRSRDEEDEYFSDGLADELLSVLSRIRGLRVVARTSSFLFKGKSDDIATIGHKLNVVTILEGSVRKAGNRIRVSVQLVKVADSSHLWSETYDRTLDDIFAVQDDIAQSVVKELRTTLLGEAPDSDASGEAKAEVAQATKGRGTDPEALRLYLRARHFLDRRTREDLARGIASLQQALELDPDFALAWTDLAGAYVYEATYSWGPVDEGFARARTALERAFALEPNLVEAYVGQGWLQMHDGWDRRAAQASLARALELSPRNARALRVAGVLAMDQGRLEDAICLYRRGLEQDPLGAGTYVSLGIALLALNRLAESEAAFRKALELTPQGAWTRAYLALTLVAQHRGEEAVAEAMRESEEGGRMVALALVHQALGHRAEADAALRELIDNYANELAYHIAEVHAARGDADAAFECLERAYANREGGLPLLTTSTTLGALHGDPRWGAFVKKMGFEDGARADPEL